MEQQLNTLLLQHERRIHYHIHRLNIRKEQYDDFYAEGMITLWRGLEDYDESKGETRRNYGQKILSGRLLRLLVVEE